MRTPLKSLNVGSGSERCARNCAGAIKVSAMAATKRVSWLTRLEKSVKEKQNIWNSSFDRCRPGTTRRKAQTTRPVQLLPSGREPVCADDNMTARITSQYFHRLPVDWRRNL